MKKSTSTVCPKISKTIVFGDHPQLLAKVSSLFSKKNTYLPVIDGPRMSREDAMSEIVRRYNVAARIQPSVIIFAELSPKTCDKFEGYFPPKIVHRITKVDDLRKKSLELPKRSPKLFNWGKDHIGLGLLQALRLNQEIVFHDNPSRNVLVPSISGHLVVCEEGDELAQVIVANYAYSIGAGMCLIPRMSDEESDYIAEKLYGLDQETTQSPTSILEELKSIIRSHIGFIDFKKHNSITFIIKNIPWGVAYSEVPTTHMFIYPDLGIALLNGIVAEQPNSQGIRIATIIDPGEVEANEVKTVINNLYNRSVFVKALNTGGATVYNATRIIELFPYDFLLISSHCGDASGWRCTYKYEDSENINRLLVVDLALGLAVVPGDDKFQVTQFYKFVSLDGIDWNDSEKKEKLYVGKAILDFTKLFTDKNFKPIKREIVDRVAWSAALRMYDGNYIPIPQSIADNGTPIIFNNACASWHRLAGSFIFGGARVYIGTLFSVTDVEAQEVAKKMMGRHFGRHLSTALWRSHNDIYGDSVRRPYVMMGVHFQKMRTTRINAPNYLIKKLLKSKSYWLKILKDTQDEHLIRTAKDHIRFLDKEVKGIYKRWVAPD